MFESRHASRNVTRFRLDQCGLRGGVALGDLFEEIVFEREIEIAWVCAHELDDVAVGIGGVTFLPLGLVQHSESEVTVRYLRIAHQQIACSLFCLVVSAGMNQTDDRV